MLTGLLPLLGERLNPAVKLWIEPRDYPFYIRGASGRIHMQIGEEKRVIGHAGLFVPDLQKKYDLRPRSGGDRSGN